MTVVPALNQFNPGFGKVHFTQPAQQPAYKFLQAFSPGVIMDTDGVGFHMTDCKFRWRQFGIHEHDPVVE